MRPIPISAPDTPPPVIAPRAIPRSVYVDAIHLNSVPKQVHAASRARVTQVMGLLHLAPDIQEAVLDLPRSYGGVDVVLETDLRAVAALAEWGRQRRAWSVRSRGRG